MVKIWINSWDSYPTNSVPVKPRIGANHREERRFRRRPDPLDDLRDDEMVDRYRLDRAAVQDLTREFGQSRFSNKTRRSQGLTPQLQVNHLVWKTPTAINVVFHSYQPILDHEPLYMCSLVVVNVTSVISPSTSVNLYLVHCKASHVTLYVSVTIRGTTDHIVML